MNDPNDIDPDEWQRDRIGCLRRVAERGNAVAACQLGDAYHAGEGVRMSPRLTYYWYARSALAGHPNGQNNLGACYEHGLGCAQSYQKALKWYRLAAAQQIGSATMNLGYLYLRGHAVPADRAEAVRLFRLAVAQDEPRAAEELQRLGESLDAPEPPDQAPTRPVRSGNSRSEVAP